MKFKILFPIAYEEHSKVVFHYAQILAKHFDASITLMHAYKSPSFLLASDIEIQNEMENNDIEEANFIQFEQELERLKSFAKQMVIKEHNDIPLKFILTDSDLEDEILEIQNESKYDLVVMGMRKSNLSSQLFGNITSHMIDKVNCPLLLIPPINQFLGLNKIIYATAFTTGDHTAIDRLLQWTYAFKAKLNLVHVCKNGNKELAELKMEKIMKKYHEENISYSISYQILEGQIATEINKYIQFREADILAIHKNKNGFWKRIIDGSLTKQLTEQSEVPILILKAQLSE